MLAPKYRDIESQEIPELHLEGVKVRAIAGSWKSQRQQLQGPLQDLAAVAAIWIFIWMQAQV